MFASSRVSLTKRLTLGLVLALLPGPALAQRVGVVVSLNGEANVIRGAARPESLRSKDYINVGDRITTGEMSLARLLLGGQAVVTLREHSDMTISERPGTSTLYLGSGKMMATLSPERMKPGVCVEIKTPSAVALICGTVLIVEVSPSPAEPTEPPNCAFASTFTLLAGIVDVALLDPTTESPGSRRFTLHSGKRLTIMGCVPPSEPRVLTEDEAKSLAAAFRVGSTPQFPPHP